MVHQQNRVLDLKEGSPLVMLKQFAVHLNADLEENRRTDIVVSEVVRKARYVVRDQLPDHGPVGSLRKTGQRDY